MALKEFTKEELARMDARHARSIKITEGAIVSLVEGAANPTEAYKALNKALLLIGEARLKAHAKARAYAHEEAAKRRVEQAQKDAAAAKKEQEQLSSTEQ